MSESVRVLVASLAGLPLGWVASVLVDRVPDARPLWRPRPALPFPRGISTSAGAIYALSVLCCALAAWRFDDLAVLAGHLGAITLLLALSFIDLETLRLPDRLTLALAAWGLAVLVVAAVAAGSSEVLVLGLAGGGGYFGVLLVAHLVYPAGMGFGDVKLSFGMGLLLGWQATSGVDVVALVVWAMLVGFGLGSVIGIAILVVRGRSTAYPFGPFLVLGAVTVMLFGADLLPEGATLRF